MKIVFDRPPNYAAIVAAFPHVPKTFGVLFCFGEYICNPDRVKIEPSIVAHEGVHSQRQGDDPEGWWDRYLIDPRFRWAEELHAHIEEYAHAAGHEPQRRIRRFHLNQIAGRLAGPLYGHLTNLEGAKRLLKMGRQYRVPQTQPELEPDE